MFIAHYLIFHTTWDMCVCVCVYVYAREAIDIYVTPALTKR